MKHGLNTDASENKSLELDLRSAKVDQQTDLDSGGLQLIERCSIRG